MDPALALAAVAPVTVIVVLWRFGAFADPYARAWASIGGARALGRDRGRRRNRAVDWCAERLDLPLQLHRAGIQATPARFLVRCAVEGATALGLVLVADAALLARQGETPIPPWLGLVAGAAVGALRLATVPAQVRARRRAIDDAMTEIMVPLAIASASGAIANRREALVLLSRALDDPTLARFVQIPEVYGETRDDLALDYRTLVPETATVDDVALFRAIGTAYNSELFTALSQAEYQVKRNRPLREALRGVADQYQGRQVSEDEQWVETARTRVTVPMSAFILLVFGAILVPTVVIILRAIGG